MASSDETGARSDAPMRWERVASERLASYTMFGTRRDRSRSPGDDSLHDFEIVESPDGVVLVALTPQDELVLVEQFRHGARERTLEPPSGVVDEGEAPLDAAVRELREETGYTGSAPELLGTMLLNPSWQTTRVHVVRVRDARRTEEKELDEAEDTRVQLVPLAEVPTLVAEGRISAAVALGALALHQAHGATSGRAAAEA